MWVSCYMHGGQVRESRLLLSLPPTLSLCLSLSVSPSLSVSLLRCLLRPWSDLLGLRASGAPTWGPPPCDTDSPRMRGGAAVRVGCHAAVTPLLTYIIFHLALQVFSRRDVGAREGGSARDGVVPRAISAFGDDPRGPQRCVMCVAAPVHHLHDTSPRVKQGRLWTVDSGCSLHPGAGEAAAAGAGVLSPEQRDDPGDQRHRSRSRVLLHRRVSIRHSQGRKMSTGLVLVKSW